MGEFRPCGFQRRDLAPNRRAQTEIDDSDQVRPRQICRRGSDRGPAFRQRQLAAALRHD